jgi:hypothetical protein
MPKEQLPPKVDVDSEFEGITTDEALAKVA